MKSILIAVIISLGVVGAFGLMQLSGQRANVEKELANLRRQQRSLGLARQENDRLRTLFTQTAKINAETSSVERERLHREVAELEKRALTRSQQLKADKVTQTTALKYNHNPEAGMTRLEQFRNVGRHTPRGAFQTLVWAAMSGDDQVLATVLSLPEATREKAEALFARLPESAHKNYSSAESLAAMAVTSELLKGGALELPSQTFTNATHALVEVRTPNGTKPAQMPMQLGSGGWQFVVPERAIDAIARRMAGEPDRKPGPGK